ncbi:MAG TPA: ComF family protein, partial [Ktedonobacteraceae bacterium]|nr:ComF family protein [Ktedonobacteraceae bacterium]
MNKQNKTPQLQPRQFIHYAQRALDLLFPPQCAGCQKHGAILCSSCLAMIPPIVAPLCQRCGASLPALSPFSASPAFTSSLCRQCQRYPPGLSKLRAMSIYQEPLRSCIHALKYEGNTRLAEPLGQMLACSFSYYNLAADVIIPVPLHADRQKARGYNHATLLANSCARYISIPVRSDILIRHRATPAQVGLTARERNRNVTGAFACMPHFATGILAGRTIGI